MPEDPKCIWCGRTGIKCPRCSNGFCFKRGFSHKKDGKYQYYFCKVCHHGITVKVD